MEELRFEASSCAYALPASSLKPCIYDQKAGKDGSANRGASLPATAFDDNVSARQHIALDRAQPGAETVIEHLIAHADDQAADK